MPHPVIHPMGLHTLNFLGAAMQIFYRNLKVSLTSIIDRTNNIYPSLLTWTKEHCFCNRFRPQLVSVHDILYSYVSILNKLLKDYPKIRWKNIYK